MKSVLAVPLLLILTSTVVSAADLFSGSSGKVRSRPVLVADSVPPVAEADFLELADSRKKGAAAVLASISFPNQASVAADFPVRLAVAFRVHQVLTEEEVKRSR